MSDSVEFSLVKAQAQSEILKIFDIDKPDLRESELLDI